MELKRLKKALERQHAQDLKNTAFYIRRGYWTTWAPEHRTQSDAGLKRHSTPGVWDKYTAGKISRADAVEKTITRATAKLNKDHAAALARLDRIAAAPDLEQVEIIVDWHRSRTWGYNPHCAVTVHAGTWAQYEGTASGYGYDKESAAAAAALNQSDAVLKMLYTAKERAVSRLGIEHNDSNDKYIAYGAGSGVLPYFESGVGMGSFENVFNACGFILAHQTHTKNADAYIFTRKKGGRKA